ncbi:MAG: hypothetical protein CL943_00885 [Candidatus Diapherotrites archaeon]|uniref:Uncharacterized protein n=1 Tax=Candidatus Iainarchaeum sp. TaxID=3101447 RepID=A0A2D6M093_9ARCH|nr:hypothetical protein [Candidatus Diapherotrites archaeon]
MIAINDNKELRQNILKAALFALFFWLAAGLFLEDLLFSLLVGMVGGLFVLGIMEYAPIAKRKRYAALVESQLPLALMNIAVEINLGLKFNEILGHVAEQNNEIGSEFRKVLREIKQQEASVQESLMHFGERIESLEVKRAIALFVSIYEQGHRAGGESLKMLSKEMLAKQRSQSKEFSGKLVVYSLLFVAISAVVPALFQSFVIVGSMILELTLTASQIFIIIVVVFPIVDLAALYYIRLKTPIFLQR